jgi:hypothetical protein
VSTGRGPTYGDTLTWSDEDKPELPLQKVHVQMDADLPKLNKSLIQLFSADTPRAQDAEILRDRRRRQARLPR